MLPIRSSARCLSTASIAVRKPHHQRLLIPHIQSSSISNKPEPPKEFDQSYKPEPSNEVKDPGESEQPESNEPTTPKKQRFSKENWTWPPWFTETHRQYWEKYIEEERQKHGIKDDEMQIADVAIPYISSALMAGGAVFLIYQSFRWRRQVSEKTKLNEAIGENVVVDITWR